MSGAFVLSVDNFRLGTDYIDCRIQAATNIIYTPPEQGLGFRDPSAVAALHLDSSSASPRIITAVSFGGPPDITYLASTVLFASANRGILIGSRNDAPPVVSPFELRVAAVRAVEAPNWGTGRQAALFALCESGREAEREAAGVRAGGTWLDPNALFSSAGDGSASLQAGLHIDGLSASGTVGAGLEEYTFFIMARDIDTGFVDAVTAQKHTADAAVTVAPRILTADVTVGLPAATRATGSRTVYMVCVEETGAPDAYSAAIIAEEMLSGTYVSSPQGVADAGAAAEAVQLPVVDLLPQTRYRIIVVIVERDESGALSDTVVTHTAALFSTLRRPLFELHPGRAMIRAADFYVHLQIFDGRGFVLDVDVRAVDPSQSQASVFAFSKVYAAAESPIATFTEALLAADLQPHQAYAFRATLTSENSEVFEADIVIVTLMDYVITVSNLSVGYNAVAASVDVINPDATAPIDIYIAVVPATVLTPEEAVAVMLSGSYPDAMAFLDQHHMYRECTFARLEPGRPYYLLVLAQERPTTSLPSNRAYTVDAFTARAAPFLLVETFAGPHEDSVAHIRVTASTAALLLDARFHVYARITDHLLASVPAMDPVALANIYESQASDSSTFIARDATLATRNPSVFFPVFEGLAPHTTYGCVAVLTDALTNAPIASGYAVLRTASMPTLDLAVVHVGLSNVRYTVDSADLDGPHSVFTAVSSAYMDAAAASNLAALGALYGGGDASGVVPGSVTVTANPLGLPALHLAFEAGGLRADAEYVVQAVAVDGGSERVRQWWQQAFRTRPRPRVAARLEHVGMRLVDISARVTSEDAQFALYCLVVPASQAELSAEAVALSEEAEVTVVRDSRGGAAVSWPEYDLSGVRLRRGVGPPALSRRVAAVARDLVSGFLSEVWLSDAFDAVEAARITVTAPREASDRIDTRSIVEAADPRHYAGDGDAYAVCLLEGHVDVTAELAARSLAAAEGRAAPGGAGDPATTSPMYRLLRLRGAALDEAAGFAGLRAAAPYTAVGVLGHRSPLLDWSTAEDDTEGSWASLQLYTRAVPLVTAAVHAFMDRATVTLAVTVTDPRAGRSNVLDVGVGLAALGDDADADRSWILASNRSAPPTTVQWTISAPHEPQVAALVTALDATVSLPGLAMATRYDLVVQVYEHATGQVTETVVPVTTRFPVTLDARDVTALFAAPGQYDTAVFAVVAALPDGTFDLYARVYAAGTLPQPQTLVENVRATGARLAAAVAAYQAQHAFSALAARTAHTAVFLAVDRLSGETALVTAAFTTPNSPPGVSIVGAALRVTDATAAVPVVARDDDTAFTVYIGFLDRDIAGSVLREALDAIVAAPLQSRRFARSPGGAPFEFALAGLAADAAYRVAVVVVDSTGLMAYDTAEFTTLGESNYMPETEYDGMWTLTYRAATTYTLPRAGVLLGNGKLAVRSSLTALTCESTYMAGVFDFNRFGGYTNNIIDTFNASGIDFFSQYSPSAFSLTTQTLNMQTGIVTSTGTVYGSGFNLAVEYDVIPLRHMPFCTLTSVRFTPSADLTDLRVFHTLRGAATLHQPRFECSVVYTKDVPVTCMLADADLKNSDMSVAAATVYFPGDSAGGAAGGAGGAGRWRCLGFNTVRNRDSGFNGFIFEGLARGEQLELSFLTAHASSADFREPLTDCKRMALGAMGNYVTAAKIRADHVSAWSRTWAHQVNLAPKLGITAAEERRVQVARRALRVAQFNIYSCIRDHTATEVNPASIDALDLDGNLFWNRELWLVPAMLYLKPRFVRAMIEHRFRALTMARAFAGSQGFEGVKYMFADDILGNEQAPYWDVTPGTYVFNTCLVAVASWDYFRVSQDKEWLASKGYNILAGIADYVCSIIDAGGVDQARSISGESVARPALTLYTCKLALKAAIEASYEMHYVQPAAWLKRFLEINLDFFDGVNFDVLKEHAAQSIDDGSKMLESVIVMQAHYSARFFKDLTARSNDRLALQSNAAFYENKGSGAYQNNPFNALCVANLYSQLCYSGPGFEAKLETLMHAALDAGRVDIWGSLHAESLQNPVSGTQTNDITLSALLVLFFITGVGGLRVTGGVAQSGYYYEKMGIDTRTFAYLPKTWDSVFVTDCFDVTHRVWNRNTYP